MEAETVNYPVRFVTATSLFDGHDASINIIRRLLQQAGAEVIHLGHNRSVRDIVEAALQEDADAVAVSSYQGGHIEYFKYLYDLLAAHDAGHIRIYGGGGGVIVPAEIDALQAYGIARIYSPDDGLRLGLAGMAAEMIAGARMAAAQKNRASDDPVVALARRLTEVERGVLPVRVPAGQMQDEGEEVTGEFCVPVLGVTGTGGAGKSTLVDELLRRFFEHDPNVRIAVLSVDPTRQRSGGALLGDRIRMNTLVGEHRDRVFMRSFATRQAHRSVSHALRQSINVCSEAGYDMVVVETAGIGQSDTEIADLANVSVYVMTPEYGAPSQLEKIGMLDAADYVVLNKFEKRGGEDALRDIRKQVQRNHGAWDEPLDRMPVYPVSASHNDDPGLDRLFEALARKFPVRVDGEKAPAGYSETVIPPDRQQYLGEIVQANRTYRTRTEAQVEVARRWGQAEAVAAELERKGIDAAAVRTLAREAQEQLAEDTRKILDGWDRLADAYRKEALAYTVRDQQIEAPLFTETLSGTRVPRVAFPRTKDPGERLRFALLENVPGRFPYTAGVYPLKRSAEDPTRMFAGEGSPERTNRRFHLVSTGMPSRRLSTAFDSVTLYGADPEQRPDVYGKIGNAGVSICTLDDMKKLYSGFDLCDPATSVSMTINGPAPIILAMFMNAAIDQQVERHLRESSGWAPVERWLEERAVPRPEYKPFGPGGLTTGLPEGHDGSGLALLGTSGAELVAAGFLAPDTYERIGATTMSTVRGTVQADILKEDQAQNTCIFSTEFALRMMADVQQYFVDHSVRNYYSVSVSGYHIAEAGANPITQLAFTLANGFTYVEYYRARGMAVDLFAPNLSFFFSNGMDAEYSVLGRVARRIWAVAMRDLYGASPRSQMLKYHIQTSGRSLHAREYQFNDIRTTLQALTAIYDNCNSLHTNAYDEAITTPTEESVRRAMAIQLIINREFGLAGNENPLQGSYIIEELTDLVEEAVLSEFDRINRRGGVLGAMELLYQRSKIQEESMVYEQRKHSGQLPIVGVNTFLSPDHKTERVPELMRSSEQEKRHQIENLRLFQERNQGMAQAALHSLQVAAARGDNLFEALMPAVRSCSLGQITRTLFEAGGAYRRSM